MLYSYCDFSETLDQLVGRKKPKVDGSYDISNRKRVKIGPRGMHYPGGQVFLTVQEAEAALQNIQIYEVPENVRPSSSELDTWVVGIGSDKTRTYQFREGLRLHENALIRTIFPISCSRFHFRTEPMLWEQIPPCLIDLRQAFPDEPWLDAIFRGIIDKQTYMPPGEKVCFMVEGPKSKEFMLAKLRFAE